VQYIYGLHAVDSLLRQNPRSVQRLLLQTGRADKRIAALLELAQNQGVSVVREPRAELDKIVSGRHQGAVAQVRAAAVPGEDAASNLWPEADLLLAVENKRGPLLILVLDGVTDPHNLGACLRSADAAGVDAVVVPRDNSADITPVVRKVACGAAEVVPFVRVTNISRTLQALQARGVWLYGTDGEAEKSIYDSDLTTSLALVMGAEGKGMRRLTREQCDYLIRLPMAGSVSSLNVSVAAGIFLFEAVRQRASASK
jgi:23S rRNA (guanosine2251-2'-O)-methyltransferase